MTRLFTQLKGESSELAKTWSLSLDCVCNVKLSIIILLVIGWTKKKEAERLEPLN